MRYPGFVSVIPALLFLGSCSIDDMWQAGISRGGVHDGIYRNRNLGITMEVPNGWVLFPDSVLDRVAGYEAERNSDKNVIEPLCLFACMNPPTSSAFAMDCFPLFRLHGVDNLDHYVLRREAELKTGLLEAGRTAEEAKVERLTIEGIPTVKFTVDTSRVGGRSIHIEYARLLSMPFSGEKLMVRQSAVLFDSAEVPVIDAAAGSYRVDLASVMSP